MRGVEDLPLALGFEGEEFGHADRHPVEDALQRAHGRVHAVGLDQGDRRIGHARAFGQRPLRQPVTDADEAQPFAHVDAHPSGLRCLC